MTVPPSPAALEAARVCLSHLYAENEVDTRWVALALDAFAHSSRAYAAGVVAGREEAATLVQDFPVVTHGGYYDNDDGSRTLWKAADAIRALPAPADAKAATNGAGAVERAAAHLVAVLDNAKLGDDPSDMKWDSGWGVCEAIDLVRAALERKAT